MNQEHDILNCFGVTDRRPPVWMMRQAGRALPRYQALRQHHSFAELMATPELAAQVTLMPVEDLGVDAAILFNDILTLPAAMGMDIVWTDHGPQFPQPLSHTDHPLNRLQLKPEKLQHVYQAIDLVVARQRAPLIGFCGAPLTTLCYMLQGISTKAAFPEAKKFFYTRPDETRQLVEAVTEASIHYATTQARHGIKAFQLFDTHAGLVPATLYAEVFLPAVKRLAKAVRDLGVPFFFFPKGLGLGLRHITPDVCDVVSIDWQTPLADARQMVHPDVALQGNMDPHLLFASQEDIASHLETTYKPFFRAHGRWIFNLGHGVLADTPIDNIKFVVNWIKETSWK